jgi:hypothetical protein
MNYLDLNLDYVMLAHRHLELYPSQRESYLAALELTSDSPQEISLHWLRCEYIDRDLVDIRRY